VADWRQADQLGSEHYLSTVRSVLDCSKPKKKENHKKQRLTKSSGYGKQPSVGTFAGINKHNRRATGNISTLSTHRTTNKRLTISLNSEQPLILEEVQQRASKAREREGDAEKRQRNRRGQGQWPWWSTGPLLPAQHSTAALTPIISARHLVCFALAFNSSSREGSPFARKGTRPLVHVRDFRLLFQKERQREILDCERGIVLFFRTEE